MEMPLYLRRFAVTIRDERTGETREDHITISKGQLQAAQTVGQSSKELIYRHYNRKGFTVLDIGKAEKKAVGVDLDKLYQAVTGE